MAFYLAFSLAWQQMQMSECPCSSVISERERRPSLGTSFSLRKEAGCEIVQDCKCPGEGMAARSLPSFYLFRTFRCSAGTTAAEHRRLYLLEPCWVFLTVHSESCLVHGCDGQWRLPRRPVHRPSYTRWTAWPFSVLSTFQKKCDKPICKII